MASMLGMADPESIGTYEGYRISNEQNKWINFNNLPFIPGYLNGGFMYDKTIDNNILHKGFEVTHPNHTKGVPHLFLHNQYGFFYHQLIYNQSRETFKVGERPNIYSESTWARSGFYGGSFQQPLNVTWTSVRNSISMAMNMGMNGVNHWVTNVCELVNSTPEK